MIDQQTLTELWHRHRDRLMLIARSIGEPAEDAVQEAFIALASQRRPPDDPLAWLVRVVRNRLIQWNRSKTRRRNRETKASSQAWFESETISKQQQLDAREVTAALQRLDSPDREIIVMHLWGGMSFDSIARVVGGSRSKAHRSFERGLQSLRKQFADDVPSPPNTNECVPRV